MKNGRLFLVVTLLISFSIFLLGLSSCQLWNKKPLAAFAFAPAAPVVGAQVTFDASSSSDPDGEIVAYSWSFGDGTRASGVIAGHIYRAAGNYTITLEVTDNKGERGTTSKGITVSAMTFIPPTAAFIFSPENPSTEDVVRFTDQSTDSDGRVVAWDWNFGDGATAVTQNPTHRYAESGNYTVTLTVTDDDRVSSSVSQVVTVNAAPIAAFSFTPASPTAEDTIQFKDESNDPDGNVVSWGWTFGDGTTSTLQNPTHKYAAPGEYEVSLTVTDDQGASGTASKRVTVGEVVKPPVADFTFSPTSPTTDETVQFTDRSTDPDGQVVGWNWNFGDGVASTDRNPTHKYANPGNYTVTLTVTDDKGKTGSKSLTVSVTEAQASISSPGSDPRGLTWDGTHLWNVDAESKKLYRLDPATGQVVTSYSIAWSFAEGLAFDGTNLWCVSNQEAKLQKLDPATGQVLGSLDAPGDDPTGLAWDGTNLWVADATGGKIYKLDPATGQVVTSFNSPAGFPVGLAWDGTNLWSTDELEGKLYKIDPATGSATTLSAPGPSPSGLAWDGSRLWVSDSEEAKIYRFTPQ